MLSYFIIPSVAVEPGKSENATVLVTPHCDALPGNYSFAVNAVSGNDTFSKTLEYRVLECHSLVLSASSTEGGVCAGENGTFRISLFNQGNFSETGTITTAVGFNNVSVPAQNFSLSPGRSKNFSFEVPVPEGTKPQNVSIAMRAASQYTYRDFSPVLFVKDCCGLTVNVSSIIEAQVDETTVVPVGFENTGKYDDNYSIELACPGFVSTAQKFIFVPKNQIRFFDVTVAPRPQDYYKAFPCIIRGVSKRCDKASAVPPIVNVSNFYRARLSSTNVQNGSLRACKGEAAVFQFGLFNQGKPANFSVKASGVPASAVFASLPFFFAERFSDTFFSVSLDTRQIPLGTHGVTLAAEASAYSANKTFSLTIDNKKCCGLTISVDSLLNASAGATLMVPVKFENTGSFDDDYAVSLECPSFVSVNASSIAVKSGAAEYAALVISPDSSTSGKFPCIVRGYSEACQRSSAVPPIINVTASSQPASTPSAEPSATAVPSPSVSIASPSPSPEAEKPDYFAAVAGLVIIALAAAAFVLFRGKLPF